MFNQNLHRNLKNSQNRCRFHTSKLKFKELTMRILPILAMVLGIGSLTVRAQVRIVVHEWGTFTSYQDESGRAIGGINTDDEPVPAFVHRVHTGIQPDSYLTP